ncbi:TPA: toprim domain-containing protein [Yersinia enterocolitica]
MNNTVQPEIIRRLIHDFQFKEQKGYLRQGVCPHCKKKELFTSLDKPYVLRCGRENKCGAEIVVKALYADLFDNWSERYPAIPAQPHAAADAYLREARGLDIAPLADAYTQGIYLQKGMGSATVRFTLPNGAHWERLIDRPERFDRKANFNGRFAGEWWSHAGQDLAGKKEIWLVEGIFDALSLNQNGIAAVSLMTCNNYPEKALHALAALYGTHPRPVLVWALDNGNAGERAIRKHVERSRSEGWTAKAALPPEGAVKADWNDLHLSGRLKPADIKNYRYNGDLLLAENATDKALLMHYQTGQQEFHFEHNARMFWFKLNVTRYMKAIERIQDTDSRISEQEAKSKALKESGTVSEIANCYPSALYYQTLKATDEAWYYLRIDFPGNNATVKAAFTATQLTSAPEFKRRLLHIAKGALYTGNVNQLDKWAKQALPNIKEVNTQNFVGYNRDYQAWIFADMAVCKGKLYLLNEEDYFEIDALNVKCLSLSPTLELNTQLDEFDTQWIDDLWCAFGVRGFISLAFWLGSLFAEQIRAMSESYPFLEIVGQPGSGKTTLLNFLWKLCGRKNYEGFDPSTSTAAARGRYFMQVGNMPVAMIEGDRSNDKSKQGEFDWSEMKKLYDGNSPRSTAVKNNGNETQDPPFRGAIVIAQNSSIIEPQPIVERIIHIATTTESHNLDKRKAAERLARISVDRVSGFMVKAILNEKAVMACFAERFEAYRTQFESNPQINHIRIAKNHAQIAVLLDALALVIPVKESQIAAAHGSLSLMAGERVQAATSDDAMVQEFWEVFDYLDTIVPHGVNHSTDSGTIAVNLNHFVQVASENRQAGFALSELKKRLKEGKHRQFIDVRSVRSAVNSRYNAGRAIALQSARPEVVKCWLFRRDKKAPAPQ